MDAKPFFSIIIPTRNEEEDILATLRSIQENTWKDFEVLVVDASKDRTPEIVKNFGDPRFKLIAQDNRDGRCGARNQGILMAQGHVTIILNADVRLTTDFLDRIKSHYNQGAEYLIIDSKVENMEHPFGFMVEAIHQTLYREGLETVDWCEGYSCLKRCAIESGLFPTGLPVPMCAGEDAIFGQNMARKFKRAEDWSIFVPHRVPETWKGFWGTRSEKGRGIPQRRAWIEGWSFNKILFESLWWSIKTFLWLILLFPWILKAKALAASIPERKHQWPKLIPPILFDRIVHEIGRWQGVKMIFKNQNYSKSVSVSKA
jgi:glycosyltransferase involved in cell wall biosynthesis